MSSTLLHFPPQSMQNGPQSPPFDDLFRQMARNRVVDESGGPGKLSGHPQRERPDDGSSPPSGTPPLDSPPVVGRSPLPPSRVPNQVTDRFELAQDGQLLLRAWAESPLNAEDPPGRVFGSGPTQQQEPGGEKSGGVGSGVKRTTISAAGTSAQKTVQSVVVGPQESSRRRSSQRSSRLDMNVLRGFPDFPAEAEFALAPDPLRIVAK